MAAENCLSSTQSNTLDNEVPRRPRVELHSLLKTAGAGPDKELFTTKEVVFYLGQYIVKKQLYDKNQQHIVYCANDPLGDVLGVESFSVKEPRILFAMIAKNLLAVTNPECQSGVPEPRSQSELDPGPQGAEPDSLPSPEQRRRRKRRRSGPASVSSIEEEEEGEGLRKRHKSDSFSLTFDDSMSWCVIGGLRGETRSSESSDSHSNTASEAGEGVGVESDRENFSVEFDVESLDSDNFSVEFEVESIDSDAYSDHDAASGEDEVYEVIFQTDEDQDSFDDDTEITEADYWKCSQCEALNPPLPRHCNRCWTLRPDWYSDPSSPAPHPQPLPPKPSPADEGEGEGLDVPDGKRVRTPPLLLKDSQTSESVCSSQPDPHSQDLACSQPSTSSTPSSAPCSAPSSQEGASAPELERWSSQEASLPASCLEPCVICQSRPKNGLIAHGRTGHLMACYTCAIKLKKRNKLCPVCRQPIQSVVLTYFS